jgi:DNA-binding NarL/FixJ family response regulator
MTTRILIVEDNPVARSFLVRVVRESFSNDIDLVECASLASARRALIQADSATPAPQAPAGQFKLVLCALELVDGHGLELLEELRHYPAIRIATTLYSDDEQLFPALQLGADGYLLKEDRFELLVEELQRIVRGQPSMSPAIARRVAAFFRSPPPRSRADTALAGPAPTLSTREADVLGHLAKGFTLKEIARVTGLRTFAINEHILGICRKLAACSVDVVVMTSEDQDS